MAISKVSQTVEFILSNESEFSKDVVEYAKVKAQILKLENKLSQTDKKVQREFKNVNSKIWHMNNNKIRTDGLKHQTLKTKIQSVDKNKLAQALGISVNELKNLL